MMSLRTLGLLSFALLAMLPQAQAQGNRDSVTCESQDNRVRECRTPFRNPVISQVLSNAPCIEGRTWGERGRGNVWVTDGCRARFVDARGNSGNGGGGWGGNNNAQGAVRCESQDGSLQECAAPRGARMTIARQLSDTRCVEGRNWGQRGSSIWVDDGCRAEFVATGSGGGFGQSMGNYGQGQDVTCSSEDRRDNSCYWDGRWGRPQLLEQLSNDVCREGYTWGYDGRNRLWVTRGCRGRFGGSRY